MTAKKQNPSKRGRKELVRGLREQVLLRFRAHYRAAKKFNPKRTKQDIVEAFLSSNGPWLREIGIAVGNYATLRNVLVAGRKERTARRQRNWGIYTNIAGQHFLTSEITYMRHVLAGGEGLAQALLKRPI
ncbi:hypothetical protein [Bradyrhizobium sp. UFLA05-112]